MNTDRDVAIAVRELSDLQGYCPAAEPHPSTSPEAIRAAQLRDVRRYLEGGGDPDPEAVSAAVVLPVEVVRRRLAELREGAA